MLEPYSDVILKQVFTDVKNLFIFGFISFFFLEKYLGGLFNVGDICSHT